jgi:probable F420-dependent oxidoreductase
VNVDGPLLGDLHEVGARAARMESDGYDGAFTFEGPHDPFFPLVLAAEHTERLELSTAIAVAFARNPMTLANIGYDLQAFSRGRTILGLGSQIKPHIERRFSMPWSRPAARMREMTLAIRAIWSAWQDGTPLRFEGEFYRHTLMTPFFDPGPNPHGPPRIRLAGVGPLMTEVAGEVADGFLIHPFSTERFIREVTWPALDAGLGRAGRTRAGFEVSFPTLDVTRRTLSFYGSTPAYKVVLDVHGWGDLQPELRRLSKQDRWDEMAALITDDILDAFCVQGPPEAIAGIVQARYGGLIDRFALNVAYAAEPARLARVVAGFRAPGSSGGQPPSRAFTTYT